MGTDATAELSAALAGLAPSDVRTGVRRIDARDESALLPAEWAAVQRATLGRRQEFAAGRVLLRELIGADGPIPMGADRAPVLPRGVVGSLAHDGEYVVAAIADDIAARAVGVDLERVGPLEPDVAALILGEDETALDPRLAFTLKEAAYKAWSSLGGRMLEHHDVRVDVAERSFRAVVRADQRPFAGWYTRAGGRWVALVVDRQNAPPDSECRPAG